MRAAQMSCIEIPVPADATRFQGEKDLARAIRLKRLLPALERGESVVFDFSAVTYTSQGFIHALIAEALKKHGEAVLDRLEFRGCSEQVKNVIELVVSYSLYGFPAVPAGPARESG